MSDGKGQDSMDDVLASIRKIVRSENKAEAAPAPEDGVVDAPLDLTPEMRLDAEAPLALTPDMQTSPAEASAVVDTEQTDAVVDMVPGTSLSPPDMSDAGLKTLVREIVMEQLSGEDAANLIRDVLREELVQGETGANISQNVMDLIRSEVAANIKS